LTLAQDCGSGRSIEAESCMTSVWYATRGVVAIFRRGIFTPHPFIHSKIGVQKRVP